MDSLENYVGIVVTVYDALKYNNTIFELLINALCDAASLDYSGKRLSFDSFAMDGALKVLLPETYNEIMTKLKADKEFEEGFGK